MKELEMARSDKLSVPVANRVCVNVLTQSAQSPDVNDNNFTFFSSLQKRIRKEVTYCTNREECLDLVIEQFKAFDPYKLDRIWAVMFDNLRVMFKNRDGNDFQPENNG